MIEIQHNFPKFIQHKPNPNHSIPSLHSIPFTPLFQSKPKSNISPGIMWPSFQKSLLLFQNHPRSSNPINSTFLSSLLKSIRTRYSLHPKRSCCSSQITKYPCNSSSILQLYFFLFQLKIESLLVIYNF